MHPIVTLASEGTCDQLEKVLRGNSLIEQDDLANALSVAVMREDRAIIQLLLDHGAMPNVCPTEHMAPISCAIEQRNSDLVRLLVEHGAYVNEPTDSGWTP